MNFTCFSVKLKMISQSLIEIGILGFALLLDIIGTSIPQWWVISSEHASTNIGLFQKCRSNGGETSCASFPERNLQDWMKAVQAMMILSILVLGGAIGSAILFSFKMRDLKQLELLSGVLGAAGAGFAVLGVIIYAAKASDSFPTGGLHAGFGLAIVSAIFAIVRTVMIFKSRNANDHNV
ncbi:hypothetical protein ACF0H5_017081 [Mactra antiquata]